MPDTEPSTLIHFATSAHPAAVCGNQNEGETVTAFHGVVTCFSCRRNPAFKGVGGSTPRPQRQTPRLLRDIVAESTELRDIVKQGLNAGTNDAEHEALTALADHFALSYDEDTDTYS